MRMASRLTIRFSGRAGRAAKSTAFTMTAIFRASLELAGSVPPWRATQRAAWEALNSELP